jgi:hypothetical protein
MSAKKEPKVVQITPQGAMLWDAPEAVQVVAASPFGRRSPVYRQGPSPARIAELRRKYASMHWHKRLPRPPAALNTAERYVAGLDDEETLI